jgi:hypothetical protein
VQFYGPIIIISSVAYVYIIWNGTDYASYFSTRNTWLMIVLAVIFFVGNTYFFIHDIFEANGDKYFHHYEVYSLSIINFLNFSFFFGTYFYHGTVLKKVLKVFKNN